VEHKNKAAENNGFPKGVTILLVLLVVFLLFLGIAGYSLFPSPKHANEESQTISPGVQSTLPRREVGQDITITGVVTQVDRQRYCVKAVIQVTSGGGTSLGRTVKVDDSILAQFSGIGPVNDWKAFSLKEGDTVRVTLHFAENSYWEAYDENLELIKG